MVDGGFELDRVRLEEARSLPSGCYDDFLRLSKALVHGPAFQWLLCDARDERLRDRVIAALGPVLQRAGLRVAQLRLGTDVAEVADLENRLSHLSQQAEVLHVLGVPGWFSAERWDAFNVRRERVAQALHSRLVFWLDADALSLAARGAPDLWSWRAGVYAFTDRPDALPVAREPRLMPGERGPVDARSMAERSRRIAEIRAWLQAHPDASDDLKVAPYDELGRLLISLGELDAALDHLRHVELPFHQRRAADRDAAITWGKVADILQARGLLDEALRIRQQEQLPVYERLGDVREKAVTMGKVADILQARGQLDEALRIRQQEQLPVYERLGDVREKAVTMGRVADILEARGQLDEALRIRQEEELPVYERLGDVRSKAVTMGKVADILQARGQLDEALRIQQQEVLPVVERLGDVRTKAVTMGQVADILQARGQLDEALRIWQQEVLPVVERLGDVREKAVTQWKVGLQFADAGDTAQAQRSLSEAYGALRSLGMPEADRLLEMARRRGIELSPAGAVSAPLKP